MFSEHFFLITPILVSWMQYSFFSAHITDSFLGRGLYGGEFSSSCRVSDSFQVYLFGSLSSMLKVVLQCLTILVFCSLLSGKEELIGPIKLY